VSDEISFLNLAPGDSVDGSLSVPVGTKGTITAMVLYPAWEPFRPRRVVLSQNAPDEGGFVPVAEVGMVFWDIYQTVGINGPGTGTEPAGLRLRAAPNPFRTTMDIAFSLDRGGQVDLRVYDVAGRLVRRIYEGELNAGPLRFAWDARNDAGKRVGSGIYFIRVETRTETAVRKVLLLR
jgi:hypothetical protein